jgi:hypothetical protein
MILHHKVSGTHPFGSSFHNPKKYPFAYIPFAGEDLQARYPAKSSVPQERLQKVKNP